VGPPIEVALTGTFSEKEHECETTRVNSWFTKENPVEAHVVHRSDLLPESDLAGPTIVFSEDTTTLLPPGTNGRIDKHGNLILEIQ
jgi:N-methylhydantoinase A/oxoprolinase/acetone carboxylase beta subunit